MASYVKPMVMVFQEYDATSNSTVSADLPPCIIGPCYHIVDAVESPLLATVGAYTTTGLSDVQFPNNAPGAKIDETSVKIVLKDCMVSLSESISVESSERNSFVVEVGKFPTAIKVGDYVVFNSSTTNFRVIGFDGTTNTIVLNRTVPTGVASFVLQREISSAEFAYNATGISIDTDAETFSAVGLKIDSHTIVSAEAYVSYTALRQDLSSVKTIETVDDIKSVLGSIVPENPLAYGVNICLANTTTPVMCVGVDSDDLVGYTAAKDRISEKDPCYAIVPLTRSTAVLSMFKTHCVEMSTSSKSKWRIALGNSELPTRKVLAEGTAKAGKDGNDHWVVMTAVDDSSFLSDSIDAGDVLEVTSGTTTATYTVSSVASDDILSITSSAPFATTFQTAASFTYTIYRTLDKDGQAEVIAATSSSYNTCRFVHVWPDTCIIDDVELPGYYLCCAVAGGIAGLPSHYGFTKLSMSGIDGVEHSNDYFSESQMDTIAGGGTFIFVQESESAVPYVRHQLTTDRSAVEFQELSFVKNFDYVSYICRDALQSYIGTWNINASTLMSIRTTLNSILENLKLDVQAKIGAPIISYKITGIEQLDSTRDRVEAYVDVTFPYPLNTVGLHIVSQ